MTIGLTLASVRVRRGHADLTGRFSLPLAIDIFEPARHFDHSPAANLADEHTAKLALPDQHRLGAAANAEQFLEGPTEANVNGEWAGDAGISCRCGLRCSHWIDPDAAG